MPPTLCGKIGMKISLKNIIMILKIKVIWFILLSNNINNLIKLYY